MGQAMLLTIPGGLTHRRASCKSKVEAGSPAFVVLILICSAGINQQQQLRQKPTVCAAGCMHCAPCSTAWCCVPCRAGQAGGVVPPLQRPHQRSSCSQRPPAASAAASADAPPQQSRGNKTQTVMAAAPHGWHCHHQHLHCNRCLYSAAGCCSEGWGSAD